MADALPDLSGRIRTIVRIRPPKGEEKGLDLSLSFPSSSCVEVYDSLRQQKLYFEVDRVYGPQAGQEEVWGPLEKCMERVLDGYSSSILAHGQTGTGKTYTMLGPEVLKGAGFKDNKSCRYTPVAKQQAIRKRLLAASR